MLYFIHCFVLLLWSFVCLTHFSNPIWLWQLIVTHTQVYIYLHSTYIYFSDILFDISLIISPFSSSNWRMHQWHRPYHHPTPALIICCRNGKSTQVNSLDFWMFHPVTNCAKLQNHQVILVQGQHQHRPQPRPPILFRRVIKIWSLVMLHCNWRKSAAERIKVMASLTEIIQGRFPFQIDKLSIRSAENEKDNDRSGSQATQALIQRRRRPKRRSTGVCNVGGEVRQTGHSTITNEWLKSIKTLIG